MPPHTAAPKQCGISKGLPALERSFKAAAIHHSQQVVVVGVYERAPYKNAPASNPIRAGHRALVSLSHPGPNHIGGVIHSDYSRAMKHRRAAAPLSLAALPG